MHDRMDKRSKGISCILYDYDSDIFFSVEDHFAKALGATWTRLQQDKKSAKPPLKQELIASQAVLFVSQAHLAQAGANCLPKEMLIASLDWT